VFHLFSMTQIGEPKEVILAHQGSSKFYVQSLTVEVPGLKPTEFVGATIMDSTRIELSMHAGAIVHYRVRIRIGNQSSKGRLSLQLHGEYSSSTTVPLVWRADDTQTKLPRGGTEDFVIPSRNLGAIQRIHLLYEGTSSCLVDAVSVHPDPLLSSDGVPLEKADDEDDKDEDGWLVFPCARCLSAEVPKAELFSGSLLEYRVAVKNGEATPGTAMVLNVKLKGDVASTGWCNLPATPLEGHRPFQAGKVDTFAIVGGVDIGTPLKIALRASFQGGLLPLSTPGWEVEWVRVTTPHRDVSSAIAKRWLNESYPRGRLTFGGSTNYVVALHTAHDSTFGFDCRVAVELFGSRACSGVIALHSITSYPFQPGNVDRFNVVCQDLGAIVELTVKHDGKGSKNRWHLSYCTVTDPQGVEAVLPCRVWLDPKERTEQVQLETSRGARYRIAVHTSNVGMTTPPSIYVLLLGSNGSSGRQVLSHDETGAPLAPTPLSVQFFGIDVSEELGEVSQVVVGHDAFNPLARWLIDRVEVTSPDGTETKFFCRIWLDRSHPSIHLTTKGASLLEKTNEEQTGLFAAMGKAMGFG